jgi:hypothetical protein
MMTEGRFVGFDGILIDEKAMKTQSICHISGFETHNKANRNERVMPALSHVVLVPVEK